MFFKPSFYIPVILLFISIFNNKIYSSNDSLIQNMNLESRIQFITGYSFNGNKIDTNNRGYFLEGEYQFFLPFLTNSKFKDKNPIESYGFVIGFKSQFFRNNLGNEKSIIFGTILKNKLGSKYLYFSAKFFYSTFDKLSHEIQLPANTNYYFGVEMIFSYEIIHFNKFGIGVNLGMDTGGLLTIHSPNYIKYSYGLNCAYNL